MATESESKAGPRLLIEPGTTIASLASVVTWPAGIVITVCHLRDGIVSVISKVRGLGTRGSALGARGSGLGDSGLGVRLKADATAVVSGFSRTPRITSFAAAPPGRSSRRA